MTFPQSLAFFALIFLNPLGAEELPMGSLGGKMKVTQGAGILTVTSLSPAGPAALAGLLSGDIITGVEGLAFTQTSLNSNDGYQGALSDLTRGMEFASSHDGLLDLSLIRPGVGSLARRGARFSTSPANQSTNS